MAIWAGIAIGTLVVSALGVLSAAFFAGAFDPVFLGSGEGTYKEYVLPGIVHKNKKGWTENEEEYDLRTRQEGSGEFAEGEQLLLEVKELTGLSFSGAQVTKVAADSWGKKKGVFRGDVLLSIVNASADHRYDPVSGTERVEWLKKLANTYWDRRLVFKRLHKKPPKETTQAPAKKTNATNHTSKQEQSKTEKTKVVVAAGGTTGEGALGVVETEETTPKVVPRKPTPETEKPTKMKMVAKTDDKPTKQPQTDVATTGDPEAAAVGAGTTPEALQEPVYIWRPAPTMPPPTARTVGDFYTLFPQGPRIEELELAAENPIFLEDIMEDSAQGDGSRSRFVAVVVMAGIVMVVFFAFLFHRYCVRVRRRRVRKVLPRYGGASGITRRHHYGP